MVEVCESRALQAVVNRFECEALPEQGPGTASGPNTVARALPVTRWHSLGRPPSPRPIIRFCSIFWSFTFAFRERLHRGPSAGRSGVVVSCSRNFLEPRAAWGSPPLRPNLLPGRTRRRGAQCASLGRRLCPQPHYCVGRSVGTTSIETEIYLLQLGGSPVHHFQAIESTPFFGDLDGRAAAGAWRRSSPRLTPIAPGRPFPASG
jgi:hypothetical protein